MRYRGEIRCICHPKMAGPLNMAIDEALSTTVHGGAPVIRLYGFSPPTFSVGRFQKTDGTVFFERLLSDGMDFVRRPTGGQAVLHDNELTYAVILSRDHIVPFKKRLVYRFVSGLLLLGLEAMGVDAAFSTDRTGDHRHPDCFATTGEYEIITAGGRKIIGSAQTTSRTACLQHGSIPLAASTHTASEYLREDAAEPPVPAASPPSSLAEELDRAIGYEEARDAFRGAFGRRFPIRESELSDEELSLSRELVRSKYGSAEWNRLR